MNLFENGNLYLKGLARRIQQLRTIHTCSPWVCLCSLFALPGTTVETLPLYYMIVEEEEEFEISAMQYLIHPKHTG